MDSLLCHTLLISYQTGIKDSKFEGRLITNAHFNEMGVGGGEGYIVNGDDGAIS